MVVSHSIILVTSLSRVILIHMKWRLDMPSLTDVYLPYAFSLKINVTVSGSTHCIPLSQLVIGDLYPFFRIQTAEMYE